MSKYTTQVRYICETAANLDQSAGFNDVNTIIANAAPKIFDFAYPIFDETYRRPLEHKILRHFYTREIAEETVGLWKLRLQDKLNIIMPYYNRLYNSELLEFNPLYNVDYQKTGDKTATTDSTDTASKNTTDTIDDETTTATTGTVTDAGTVKNAGTIDDTATSHTSDTATTTGEKWDLFSDTPQGSIQNVDITNNSYLSNVRKNTDNTTGATTGSTTFSATKTTNMTDTENKTKTYDTNVSAVRDYGKSSSETASKTGNVETTDEYAEHVIGKTAGATYSKMLSEFRETFLNIDKMVIDELEVLFFGLWD